MFQWFTVVGYFNDTGLAYVGHHHCLEKDAAARQAFEISDQMVIVAIFEGEQCDVSLNEHCMTGPEDL
ncbi:hypothetical protein [Planctomicrobium piriforme]|uniref:Uncharacterized protein n=1 Tax=Planctomicrobium piriforme TaxID=1576369 RepID=A0A1I3EF47_9PLAN|nr:hypothetical protein [Planctomicrobium piriforme]SFH97577.1 hypothetical protein SAMN05421753_104196 [Planctomicrobium piriforme]